MKDISIDSSLTLNGTIFFDKYKIIEKIGEGSFGSVYKCEYNNSFYAMKIEEPENGKSLLKSEGQIMHLLKCPNIPKIELMGNSGKYNILIMQLLGKSLEDLFEERRRFSLNTICQIAIQAISTLEFIHNRHYIHRDMKPDNFAMGLNDLNHYLYLIDFGLAKLYRSPKTLIQNPMIVKKKLTGTARYASINALKGLEQSRRDDLEGLAYVLMYLLRGNLPWQGLQAKTKEERYKKILEIKLQVSSMELCDGFPEELMFFVNYTKHLEYTENPDYEKCRNFFKKIMIDLDYKFNYIYDWTTDNEIKIRKEYTFKTAADSHYVNTHLHFLDIENRRESKNIEDIKYNSESKLNNKNNLSNNNNTENNNKLKDKEDNKCCIII